MLVLVLMVIRQRITRGSLFKSPVTRATRRDRRSHSGTGHGDGQSGHGEECICQGGGLRVRERAGASAQRALRALHELKDEEFWPVA